MSETKTLINQNYSTVMQEFQDHVQQGWEIDPNNPPNIWGICYEVTLVRSDKTLAAMASRIPGAEPKMSRAETLQVAREAKAAKRAQEQANGH